MALHAYKTIDKYDPGQLIRLADLANSMGKTSHEMFELVDEIGAEPEGLYSGNKIPDGFLYKRSEILSALLNQQGGDNSEDEGKRQRRQFDVPQWQSYDSKKYGSVGEMAEAMKLPRHAIDNCIQKYNLEPVARSRQGAQKLAWVYDREQVNKALIAHNERIVGRVDSKIHMSREELAQELQEIFKQELPINAVTTVLGLIPMICERKSYYERSKVKEAIGGMIALRTKIMGVDLVEKEKQGVELWPKRKRSEG